MSYSPRRGWDWARFSEIAQIAANLVNPSEWQDLPHIAPDNIARNTGTLLAYRTIRADGVTSPKHRFYPGQILYSKIRPYLNKCVRVNFEGLCSADMYPIVAYVDASYLHHYMLTREFVAAVSEASGSRTVLPKTNQAQLADVPVPIAPLLEQRRIVDAIESYFTRLDDAVATLQRVQRNLKHYRASVLKAAVEGRLVATEAELARTDGRSYESASILLERILAERRRRWEEAELARMKVTGKAPKDDRWKANYKEPVVPATATVPNLPEGWSQATLGAVAAIKGGLTKGQRIRHGEPYRTVPYLRVANVQRGFLDLSEVKAIAATEAQIDELRLESGDVLFNEGGDRDKLGRGWIWRGELAECIHQNHVFRARIYTRDLLPEFLSWYGNTVGQAYFFDEGKHTTNLASINMTKLRGLPVPIPPLAEQRRIRGAVDAQLSVADAVLEATTKELARLARLRQSILKWAFEGRLVDQDPTDEPAARLLERIRAERESAVNHTPARRRSRRRKPQSGTTIAPDPLEPHA